MVDARGSNLKLKGESKTEAKPRKRKHDSSYATGLESSLRKKMVGRGRILKPKCTTNSLHKHDCASTRPGAITKPACYRRWQWLWWLCTLHCTTRVAHSAFPTRTVGTRHLLVPIADLGDLNRKLASEPRYVFMCKFSHLDSITGLPSFTDVIHAPCNGNVTVTRKKPCSRGR